MTLRVYIAQWFRRELGLDTGLAAASHEFLSAFTERGRTRIVNGRPHGRRTHIFTNQLAWWCQQRLGDGAPADPEPEVLH